MSFRKRRLTYRLPEGLDEDAARERTRVIAAFASRLGKSTTQDDVCERILARTATTDVRRLPGLEDLVSKAEQGKVRARGTGPTTTVRDLGSPGRAATWPVDTPTT